MRLPTQSASWPGAQRGMSGLPAGLGARGTPPGGSAINETTVRAVATASSTISTRRRRGSGL